MTGARLDRMPVAIELATARADALLLDRIDDRFALLAEGDRLAQDRLAQGRQRSLAASVQWSYEHGQPALGLLGRAPG